MKLLQNILFVALILAGNSLDAQTGSNNSYRIVAVSNDNIESVSNTVEMTEHISLFIPNAFSPDNDNINDLLTIKGKGVDDFEIQIFNRWGQQIFSTKDINHFWDGTYMGAIVPQGVYTYRVVAYNNEYDKSKEITGNITVVR